MAPITTFTDNFTGTILDTSKWSSYYGNGTITQSEVLTITPSSSATGYNGIQTLNSYDLTGASYFLKVIQVGNPAKTVDTYTKLYIDGNNNLEILQEAGTLYFRKTVATVTTAVATVTYSATTHAWWRIRESGGTIYWDTSIDGLTWTNGASAANPFAVSALYAEIGCGNYQIQSDSGSAIFDSLNILAGRLATQSKPTTSLVNPTKVVNYETWDSNTSTWDTETRTWDEMSTIWTNQSINASDFFFSLRRFPFTETAPFLSGGMTNQSKP